MNNEKIWLVGPGNIGLDYVKVLNHFGLNYDVIGRSPKPKFPAKVYPHGIEEYIEINSDNIAKYAIVAVDESQLFKVTRQLINCGVENILIEKPAGTNITQIKTLIAESLDKSCNLYVAYNRRFYQSVKKCKEIVSKSLGPVNVHFTFTEWSHLIDFDSYNKEELEHFFLCNSSHVPDTVFHIFGKPCELNTYTQGSLEWHPSACTFNGSGITESGVQISYDANWSSAGRWGIEINLPEKKLILRPLEKLQIQKKGSLDINYIDLDEEEKDTEFKPGLLEEVRSFLTDRKDLCTIQEQLDNFKWYYKIANYSQEPQA
jgi:predicted dehydrogenase